MLHLHWKKIGLVALMLIALPHLLFAQLNYQEFAFKKLYFGITLGYNSSRFKVVRSKDFTYSDSVQVVNSTRGPGFNLGIVSNLKLGKYFDLRFIPSLVFAEKHLDYTMKYDSSTTKKIESILLDFPLDVRFKSQPIKDIRIYVLAGMKYSLDLASNAKARKASDQVKINRNDISVEYGLGIQFFFPLFIFSPEIKFSNGLFNVYSRDPNLIYSRVIDKLYSRSLMVSLHFEG